MASETAAPVVYGGFRGAEVTSQPFTFGTVRSADRGEAGRTRDLLQLEEMARGLLQRLEALERHGGVRDQELVLKALENPEYVWRSISGISEETGLVPNAVARVLANPNLDIVKSSRFTKDGEELFTTRPHYRSYAPLSSKILSAVNNEVY